MNEQTSSKKFRRRSFLRTVTAAGLAAPAFSMAGMPPSDTSNGQQPAATTNGRDALKYPRTESSLPGRYRGRVALVHDEKSVENDIFNSDVIDNMIAQGMLSLTGEKSLKSAWRQFVKPGEMIGLKLNPIGGKPLSTSHEVVRSVIGQLLAAGIKESHLVLWDRREFQLHEAGFTPEAYPGIKVTGTEQMDKNGSYYDSDGKLYGEKMIDREWVYRANVEMKYDQYTIPFMINEGEDSYFTRLVTKDLQKIINIPILKNAGANVTLCLKNLAFGCISNTSRLHGQLWNNTVAEVPAFPPIRDKVVLNIVDGIKGCYNGGPGANPQFFTYYKDIIIGTDPVAVDRVGYNIVMAKRIEKGIQKEDTGSGIVTLRMANEMGLGEFETEKITLI
ncbi:MAG: DUF362 domain-containing protein, partial [Bacteroidales bacterium]|nr:DUF362 domain-containing protein [Bacteroidales bacterium]